MKIYVAGASSEIERAEKWMAALREAGFEVVSTWPEVIRKVGAANPMTAPREDRGGWAAEDLSQVATASVFWYLIPPKGVQSDGANTEYGYALMLGALSQEARMAGINAPVYRLVSSGTERSIFTALSQHFATDDEAFAALKVQLGFERMLQKGKAPVVGDIPVSEGG